LLLELVVLGVSTASVDVHSCSDWIPFIELIEAILTAASITILAVVEFNFCLIEKLGRLIFYWRSWV